MSTAGTDTRSLATVTEAPQAAKPTAPPRIVKKETGESVAIHTAVLLNRNPLLTRTPTPFEKAYYAYHSRIERALHNPLPYDFFFKPGTQLEKQFDKEELERERQAFGRSATPSSRIKTEEETRATDEDGADALAVLDAQQQDDAVKTLSREHEADRTGNVQSLDRQGERNVYLLVLAKDEAGKQTWRFPQAPVKVQENLFQSVQNYLRSPFGVGMDTWVVSRNPIGVYSAPAVQKSQDDLRNTLFFYKAHILAGQVRPDGQDVLDFAWLTKEEIQTRVDEGYWHGVKDMISDF
ncbi:50S ribosomal subunit L30 [Trametopsis cervina]|nr:50S ribosomal subunit L30 [Trametopsis cervina]